MVPSFFTSTVLPFFAGVTFIGAILIASDSVFAGAACAAAGVSAAVLFSAGAAGMSDLSEDSLAIGASEPRPCFRSAAQAVRTQRETMARSLALRMRAALAPRSGARKYRTAYGFGIRIVLIIKE